MSRAFTPRVVDRLADRTAARVSTLLDAMKRAVDGLLSVLQRLFAARADSAFDRAMSPSS